MKMYTPKELNDLLLNDTCTIAEKLNNVVMVGEIQHCKVWRRCGMNFKLVNSNNSFECKAWEKNDCDLDEIVSYENKTCIVTGYIEAEYFYSHKFILNVTNIELKSNKKIISTLKKECEQKDYFINKKTIQWNSINSIGIISKKSTQGYDDFMKQFKLPIPIITEEITLEGNKTSSQCIKSIETLQDNVDIILIIRGGGDTSEISNSFDKINLFDSMKKSKIPIVTAIGHENDKGDKLLITEISDLNFSTPSTAANEITKIIIKPILHTIDTIITHIYNEYNTMINNKKNKLYNNLHNEFNNHKKTLFEGPIVSISDNDKYIIIQKNNIFYKMEINLTKELHDSNYNDTIVKYNNLESAINEHNLTVIKDMINDIHLSNNNISDCINELIKLKQLQLKNTTDMNINNHTNNKYYCKLCDFTDINNDDYQCLYSLYNYYKKCFLEETYHEEIFNYFYCE